ncbi:MAG: tetratricopeptide repeat protein [Pirellulales bacterium]|nr:tetratricopeptide repeat protein [Pirellulales bacterium]
MAQHALNLLEPVTEAGTFHGHVQYLRGAALRELKRYADAIAPLGEAGELKPSNINVWLALGWCQKRLGRLDLAIEALEQAREIRPNEAVVHYNLACYWSLARNKERALDCLARALDIDADYRDLIGNEPDFDPLRSDPDFQALTSIIV